MNSITKKLLAIPFILVFLAVSIQAASFTTSLFYDATTEDSWQMMYGQNVGVIISADSIFEDSMTITLDLLDSSGDLVNNLLEVYMESDEDGFIDYSNYLTLNPAIYLSPGDYTIVSTITATSGETNSTTLYLGVLPLPPTNSPPVIISTPTTEINETNTFTYQVIATDADGDTLTYSLTQTPAWLSMDAFGYISGTAPNVESDYNYLITVRVSDGTTFDTQTFELIVRDINQDGDTTPPFITVISPNNNQLFNIPDVLFEITTNEVVGNTWAVLDGTTNIILNQITSTNFVETYSLADGSYTVTFYATDLAGNTGQSNTIDFSVDTTIPDTTPPVITIISPQDQASYTNHITTIDYFVTDANLDRCWYSIDNGVTNTTITCNIPITRITSIEGTNTWTVYAIDFAGNQASQSVTFDVDTSTTNNPPVITSTPITQINESQIYTYQVIATDTDNDALTYSFIGPGWLSMDASTGLLEGTAPSVDTDISFNISIIVSDTQRNNTQDYVLTVMNIVVPPQDTTPPVITITSPQDGADYTSHVTSITYTVTDNVSLDSCWYSFDNGLTNILTTCNAVISGITSVEGTNTWTVYAIDFAGNQASQSVTFDVDTSRDDDDDDDDDRRRRPVIQELDFETQKYLDQFAKKTVLPEDLADKEIKEIKRPFDLKILAIILGLLCLIFFIFIILILLRRLE